MAVRTSPGQVSRGFTIRYALLWFGFWTANLAPVQLVLPDQFDRFDAAHKVRDFGLVSGATGLVALVALPVFGALCDRTRSRYGRRRVWIASGAAVFAAGLVATGLQSTWVGVGIAWLVATIGIDMATAGATAVIADRVPEDQRGAISAAIYGPQAVGILVGRRAADRDRHRGRARLRRCSRCCCSPAPHRSCAATARCCRPNSRRCRCGRSSRRCGCATPTSAGRSAGGCWSTSATRSARPTCSTSCRTI